MAKNCDDKKCTGNENLLTKQGCKNTKSRKIIIDMLQKAKTPISADDIYMGVREKGNAVNLSTVYRTLDLMVVKNLVNKILMGDGKSRFELTGDGHKHHLICTNCHKMVPIEVCPLETLEKDVCTRTKFDITGHKLELYGICPECKNADND